MFANARKRTAKLLWSLLLTSWPSLALAQLEDCAEDLLYPPDELVEGKTLGEWAARYWQWILGIPTPVNPVLDPTGEHCGQEQQDRIFLLPGNIIQGNDPVVRTKCAAPCDLPIFAGIYSVIFWMPGDCPNGIDECLRFAEEDVQKVSALRLEVDGRSIDCLEDHRAVSLAFQFTVPVDNIVGLGPPLERTGVSVGYYVILRPLAPGQHTLTWNVIYHGAELPPLTYELTVGPCDGADFRRADSDGNGTVNVTDAVTTLTFLFAGAEALPCLDAADADDDGTLTVTDAVFTLRWLFQGGTIPPAPGPADCGPDPTGDSLDCGKGC